jgi:predicted nucleic acid-binding protein
MKYVLDTDILIYYLKNQPHVVEKFVATDPDEIATTIINYTELLFGAYHSLRVCEDTKRCVTAQKDAPNAPYAR